MKMQWSQILISFCLVALWVSSVNALDATQTATVSQLTTLTKSYRLELVTDKVKIPWSIVQLPDNSLLMTDRDGQILLYKNGVVKPIKGVPKVENRGQGGLLDLVLDPNFAKNRTLYFSYSYPKTDKGQNTSIAKAELQGLELKNLTILFKGKPLSKRNVHYGSRIVVRPPYLYFSIGDRGMRDQWPQDKLADAGKIFRISTDGTIPKDNPFSTANNRGKSAVYSYGHRNPQGLAYDTVTNQLWEHEHGPKGGDEINIITKGSNYEWPLASFGINYSGTAFTDKTKIAGGTSPIWYWTPSIAPSDMLFVNSQIFSEINNQLLIGSLKFSKLVLMLRDKQQVYAQIDLFEGFGRFRSVTQGIDQAIYVGVDRKGVFKLIKSKNPKPD